MAVRLVPRCVTTSHSHVTAPYRSSRILQQTFIHFHVHAEQAPEMYEGLLRKRDEFLAVTMHW